MTQTDKAPSQARKSRWIRIALGLSLAANLAFVGLVAGSAWRHKGGDRRPAFSAIAGYAQPYMQALPRAQRRQIFRDIRSGALGDVPNRDARLANFAAVLAALKQEPFEAAQVRAALEGQTKVIARIQSVAQDAWVAQVSQMSSQDRADYVEKLDELLQRGRQKRDKNRR
ncbi:MAG: periplasmic heavy metal sensor [Sulfitobacter sp.]